MPGKKYIYFLDYMVKMNFMLRQLISRCVFLKSKTVSIQHRRISLLHHTIFFFFFFFFSEFRICQTTSSGVLFLFLFLFFSSWSGTSSTPNWSKQKFFWNINKTKQIKGFELSKKKMMVQIYKSSRSPVRYLNVNFFINIYI